MPHHIIPSILMSIALLLCASLSAAVEIRPEPIAAAKSLHAASAPKKNGKVKDAKAVANIKPVDLNHAGKAELKSLPGISATMADQIIAGRPYNSKAAIVTDGIVPAGIFLAIKARIEVR